MNRSATKARASIALATMAMGLLLGCGTAGADPTATWLPGVFPWDISSDGSVVVGNTVGVYEAFRWTAESGVVPLGMNPGSHGMNGGGTPDVSEDGLHVSATIITPDTTGSTQGLWTKGVGWKWSMPPIPDLPDYPGMPDTAYVGMGDDLGSCWGLSGDGKTLTGFVWISRSGLGTAWGNTWSEEDGVVFLAKRARSFRINDANYDGSVTVGWSERDDGTRCPTVWEDGGYTVLHDSGWFCGAEGVSADGNTVWGQAYNPSNGTIEAAIWQRTESGWVEQIIGSLPGTFPGYGAAVCRAMTDDGSIIVGDNFYDWYSGEAFVWTHEQGMMAAEDFLAAEGFVWPPNFRVSAVTAISDNGLVLAGFGYDTSIFPEQWEGFVIRRDYVAGVPGTTARGLLMEANYPNPFNPSTRIALAVDFDQKVRLGVFDVAGRLVRRLHDGTLVAGRQEFIWDGKDDGDLLAASGVYFARATAESGEVLSQRMVLIK